MHNFIPRFFVLILALSVPALRAAAEPWQWSGGGNSLRVEASGGGRVIEWTVGGKTLVDGADAHAPLSLVAADGRAFVFSAISGETTAPNRFQLRGNWQHAETVIPVTVAYEVLEDGRQLAVRIEPGKAPDGLRVREFGWSLALSLNLRKRAYLLGDYGLGWDTRYFYQTILDPGDGWKIMKEPDRNEWRFFGLDQLGAGTVRLWKSESARTAPLIMHQGRFAAPFAQLYDEQGGVTLEYPELAVRAPASLRVDAGGGGRLQAQFWPRSATEGDGASVLGGSRTLRFHAHASEAAALEFQNHLQEIHAADSTPRPDPARVLDEAEWVVKAASDARASLQISGGYPFARGEVTEAGSIRVAVAGEAVPVQAKALAFWPDRSIKWALLTFSADMSRAVAACEPPRVSLRDGRFLPVRVTIGGPVAQASSQLVVSQASPDEVAITTGDLAMKLRTGTKWLRELSRGGRSLLDPKSDGVRVYSDYRYDPEAAFPFDQSLPGGEDDRGVLTVKSLQVEEAGPSRAVVRLEGLTTNREPTRIVLRLEFQAGRPEIRIAHTAVLRFEDPRRTFLTGMGLELPLAPGLFSEVRAQSSAPWGGVQVAGRAGSLTAVLRNAPQLAPNAVVADLSAGRLRVELWPTDAAPMDMRRYSEHLQFGQLESAATETPGTWVNEVYYNEHPVYGLSRTHEVLLAFDPAEKAPDAVSLAADFQSGPLMYAGWDRYAATGVVLPSVTARQAPRAWEAWTRLTRFFLFHRELYGWYGFWNFGDFRHRMGGFGGIVSPEILKKMPADGQLANRIWDNIPANDWGYDNGTYGWTNTEGLPALFLANEYLRHGNRAVYFAAEALARHSRDVIVRQEGRWLGRGTRHGVQPWSDGNHEERQTSATEYRYHYLLSGDGRTRDVIENLYQNVYLKGTVNRHASHSGRLMGLLFHWELTGDEAEGERLKNYVHRFLSEDGIYVSPAVRFPAATQEAAPKELNSGSQFFHTFGAMHALLEYQQWTDDPALARSLVRMADAIIVRPIIEQKRLGLGDYSWPPVAFAALHAENKEPYRAFLRRYIESGGWKNAYQPVTEDPRHWTGPSAYMASTVALSFFWANWAPYVMQAVEAEPWTAEIGADYGNFEAKGRGTPSRRPSWQSQFDGIPEIDAYLGPQQPWRKQ